MPVIHCLAALCVGLVSLPAVAAPPPVAAPTTQPDRAELWDPSTTRVFIVSLATFAGESPGHTSFTTEDRNDHDLAKLLIARGVPADQVVLMLDADATTKAVKAAFEAFLAASRPGETLIFDFSSHGGYDAKSGVHTYSTFDGSIHASYFVAAIETQFRGARAILFSDACYSGGLVALAAATRATRPATDGPRIAYAALSSTGPHNLAHSGWRFFEVILRAFGGAPEVDLDHDHVIRWDEFARYAAHHMAFVAFGKPDVTRTDGFPADFVLAQDVPAKADPRIGLYAEIRTSSGRERIEVIGGRGAKLLAHPTAGVTHDGDRWVEASALQLPKVTRYDPGTKVEVWYHGDETWYPATVRATFDELTLAHYDGYTSAWDEWFPPDAIRPLSGE